MQLAARVRRVGVSLTFALLVALVPAVAHASAALTSAAVKPAQSGTEAPGRRPDVTRGGSGNSLIVAAKPVKHRHLALDLLTCVAFVAAFGALLDRANRHSGRRFRFDALHAYRRGPPILAPAY